MTDVELDVGIAGVERLGVGVGRDELDATETCVNHPVDGVGSAAADSDDLDHCEIATGLIVSHKILSDPRLIV